MFNYRVIDSINIFFYTNRIGCSFILGKPFATSWLRPTGSETFLIWSILFSSIPRLRSFRKRLVYVVWKLCGLGLLEKVSYIGIVGTIHPVQIYIVLVTYWGSLYFIRYVFFYIQESNSGIINTFNPFRINVQRGTGRRTQLERLWKRQTIPIWKRNWV